MRASAVRGERNPDGGHRDRLTPWALGLLATGMAANAVLGSLVLGAIEAPVSDSAESQLRGGELVSLLVAAPLALAAALAWRRGAAVAPLLALGPALYATYTYVTFAVGPQYDRYPGNSERAFPFYVALVVLGWTIAVRAWARLEAPPLGAGTRRLLAGLLLAVGVLFALAWLAGIADVVDGEPYPTGYADDPTLFWLIRLLDLGFVIPAALAAAVGLLRGTRRAERLAAALAPFVALLVASVAAMAALLELDDDPAASPSLLVATLAFALGFALVTARLVARSRVS